MKRFLHQVETRKKKFEPQMGKIKKLLALLTICRYGKPEMA